MELKTSPPPFDKEKRRKSLTETPYTLEDLCVEWGSGIYTKNLISAFDILLSLA